MILFIIIISFSHAFYIILKPRKGFNLSDSPDLDDPNNPWSLTIRYYTYLTSNNSISSNSPYLVQGPDGNTNMFMGLGSSMFAIYKFLTGN